MVSSDFSYVKLGFLRLVHQHLTGFSVGIVTKAAPRPLSWFSKPQSVGQL
jgi:hypothetical protein